MNVLIADKFESSGVEGIKALGCQVAYEPTAGAEDLPGAITRTKPEILVVRSSKVTPKAIEAGTGLKGIIRAGAGVDNIDLPTASAKGIAVCNCPGMNAVAVAELTMGLIIACDRRIPDQTAALKAGQWNKKEFAKARGLKGLTLAVVGMGAIGRAVAERASAFGMRVVGWSRSLTNESARTQGVEFGGSDRAALLRLAASADIVSIHVAATPDTARMCDAAFFDAMKPGSIFINTARGSVADEPALRSAITGKGIRAGLDVLENQPAAAQAAWESPTAALPGVVLTHHCGASTDQAQNAVADEVVRIVSVYQASKRFENRVNGDRR